MRKRLMLRVIIDYCAVIASKAKQSSVERSILDCRVATLLAMTYFSHSLGNEKS
jgi:hypothetical protein